MDEILKLEILTPDKLFFSERCKKIVAYGEAGYFTVLPGHMKMVSNLNIGELKIDTETEDDLEKESLPFFVAGGCMKIYKNVIQVVTGAAEKIDDIDIDRAKQSMDQAVEILRDVKGGIDYNRAKLAYSRAETRIALAKKYGRGGDD
ncbi:ATP synthase F1 subunit epsilon [bacterium]|nr:ATP synthase F1 subunit epsilon [bacterium]